MNSSLNTGLRIKGIRIKDYGLWIRGLRIRGLRIMDYGLED
jgi:hypothetical protein